MTHLTESQLQLLGELRKHMMPFTGSADEAALIAFGYAERMPEPTRFGITAEGKQAWGERNFPRFPLTPALARLAAKFLSDDTGAGGDYIWPTDQLPSVSEEALVAIIEAGGGGEKVPRDPQGRPAVQEFEVRAALATILRMGV